MRSSRKHYNNPSKRYHSHNTIRIPRLTITMNILSLTVKFNNMKLVTN